MKKLFIPLLLVAVVSCNSGSEEKDSVQVAKEENSSKDSTSAASENYTEDKIFVVEAASGGMMEVQLGKYAAANASSTAVKQFGQMMVNDHSKADSALTEMARIKGIIIPSIPGEKHQKHIDELTKKKGAEFDKAYMKLMVEDHEEDVKKFEAAAKNLKNEDIKAFAAQTLPVLRQHLEHAKKLRDQLK